MGKLLRFIVPTSSSTFASLATTRRELAEEFRAAGDGLQARLLEADALSFDALADAQRAREKALVEQRARRARNEAIARGLVDELEGEETA